MTLVTVCWDWFEQQGSLTFKGNGKKQLRGVYREKITIGTVRWNWFNYGCTLPFNGRSYNSEISRPKSGNRVGLDKCHAARIKKVEEATNGRVKIEPYFSQTLAKGKDSWSAVKNGIADMAWCPHGYWPGMTPMASVITLAGLPIDSAEKGSEVL
jgi:hypothetical protein